LRARFSSCHPTNIVKALKETQNIDPKQDKDPLDSFFFDPAMAWELITAGRGDDFPIIWSGEDDHANCPPRFSKIPLRIHQNTVFQAK